MLNQVVKCDDGTPVLKDVLCLSLSVYVIAAPRQTFLDVTAWITGGPGESRVPEGGEVEDEKDDGGDASGTGGGGAGKVRGAIRVGALSFKG